MSGIYGIVHTDGAPVDRGLLESLTASMAFRGSDARHVRMLGAAGLGHALLQTADTPAFETQPSGLGRLWITADARIDAQQDLRRQLESSGQQVGPDADDASLILHAYRAWGESCVQHLLGDFAFGIWDGDRGRLFCARDHFGVKPFFYAIVGKRLIFSNRFDCVRAHPAVTRRLDEMAIGDFLLFEMSQDASATAFADIRRLPPAHCLSFGGDGLATMPYWTIPGGEAIEYRRDAREYVEGFSAVFRAAVADRLRTNRAGILMSGGLDSSAVAAVAVDELAPRAMGEVRAHTVVYDELFPDEERLYSGFVAKRLGIPIDYRVADDYGLFERMEGLTFAEPVLEPFAAVDVDVARHAATYARVMLTGWDGDTLLNESPRPYMRQLLEKRDYARLAATGLGYAVRERKIVPAAWLPALRRGKESRSTAALPPWLDAGFEKRMGLGERLSEATRDAPAADRVRPHAIGSLRFLARMSRFFELSDPGFTRAPIEYRHPFIDLRVVKYCLSLPPYPWCANKEILRQSMRESLPRQVLARPKTPLGGFPHHEHLRRAEARWIDSARFAARTAAYVNRDKIPSACSEPDAGKSWTHLRPLCLDLWLRQIEKSATPKLEITHEHA